jgi:hypothetical protein
MFSAQVYLPRQGDRETFLELYNQYKDLTDELLTKECESAKKVGVVGSHLQSLRLIALYLASKDRDIPCCISFEQNCLISFKD